MELQEKEAEARAADEQLEKDAFEALRQTEDVEQEAVQLFLQRQREEVSEVGAGTRGREYARSRTVGPVPCGIVAASRALVRGLFFCGHGFYIRQR